ncbi:hypothetical protein P4S72_04675 [Vibrio sp. PP-XX7]
MGVVYAAIRHKIGNISYTYYCMANLSKYFSVYEGEGTVFGSINQKALKALPTLKVDENIVESFEQICIKWDKKIEVNSLDILSLTQLRDTLLPKLISGELRLDSAEIKQAQALVGEAG